MITQERLKEILSYNPETGEFSRSRSAGKNYRKKCGWVSKKGYFKIRVDGRQYYAQRLAWLYVHGNHPSGDIDHINHDKLDNRITNLRDVSRSYNSRNRSPTKYNPTGHMNVFRQQGKYQVSAAKKYIGIYETIDEAVAARDKHLVNMGYHENHGKNVLLDEQGD